MYDTYTEVQLGKHFVKVRAGDFYAFDINDFVFEKCGLFSVKKITSMLFYFLSLS